MFSILSQSKGMHFCDGLSRREVLRVGGLGSLGLGLPALLRGQASGATGGGTFGRTKRVILLYMWGGPAHQDTWDLKPAAPAEIRGEFFPIATNVPGMHVSEHFPLIAQHAEKLAILRSVGQEDNNHSTGAHAALTGRRHELQAESFAARDSDFPHFGSVLSMLRPNENGLPTFVALPEVISTTNGAVTPGQGGGFLGKKYDPFRINQHPDLENFSVPSLTLPEHLPYTRMNRRLSLLEHIEQTARLAERATNVAAMDAFYQRAMAMVLSPTVRKAFDLAAEADAARERYGWHPFGQSVLLARRLIEAGVQLVTVYWHRERPTIDTTWDTHALNFQELKNRLMPSVDRPIATLLADLQSRGLLEETLVVWNSEFGRTPRINANAGRDHWGACNSVVMAGGGIPGGQVFGASDENAASPARDKVTQDDIAATIYHLLGVDTQTVIHDALHRPYSLALGKPIAKLLGGLSRPSALSGSAPPVRIASLGPFAQMLRQRGGRFLNLELANPESERQWQLTGWSQPLQRGSSRCRSLLAEAATVKYQGIFYPHFDYGWLVFRLAEAQPLEGLTLLLEGRSLKIPEDLLAAASAPLWQIPFPEGMIAATKVFELQVHRTGWHVTDLAVLGERIQPRHLRQLET